MTNLTVKTNSQALFNTHAATSTPIFSNSHNHLFKIHYFLSKFSIYQFPIKFIDFLEACNATDFTQLSGIEASVGASIYVFNIS